MRARDNDSLLALVSLGSLGKSTDDHDSDYLRMRSQIPISPPDSYPVSPLSGTGAAELRCDSDFGNSALILYGRQLLEVC